MKSSYNELQCNFRISFSITWEVEGWYKRQRVIHFRLYTITGCCAEWRLKLLSFPFFFFFARVHYVNVEFTLCVSNVGAATLQAIPCREMASPKTFSCLHKSPSDVSWTSKLQAVTILLNLYDNLIQHDYTWKIYQFSSIKAIEIQTYV